MTIKTNSETTRDEIDKINSQNYLNIYILAFEIESEKERFYLRMSKQCVPLLLGNIKDWSWSWQLN